MLSLVDLWIGDIYAIDCTVTLIWEGGVVRDA